MCVLNAQVFKIFYIILKLLFTKIIPNSNNYAYEIINYMHVLNQRKMFIPHIYQSITFPIKNIN